MRYADDEGASGSILIPPAVGPAVGTSHAMVPFNPIHSGVMDVSSEEEEPLQRRRVSRSEPAPRRSQPSQVVSSEDDASSQELSEASFNLPTIEATLPPTPVMPPVSGDYIRNPEKRVVAPLKVPDTQEVPSGRVPERPVFFTEGERVPSTSGPSPQGRNSPSLPCFSITPEGLKSWMPMNDDSRQERMGHGLNEVFPMPSFFWILLGTYPLLRSNPFVFCSYFMAPMILYSA